MGFSDAKKRILKALQNGDFQHELERSSIETQNLLAMGQVTKEQVASVILKCKGFNHASSPHHCDGSIEVHVLTKDGWYIKFYFVDPNAVFISVHQ